MPTRTFIGLICLVFAMIVASTPALLTPLAGAAQRGLDTAGVPGMSTDDGRATRAEREPSDAVEDTLQLKGYEVGETDLVDMYGAEQRTTEAMRPNGRTSRGSRRALLPGVQPTIDGQNPPVRAAGGLLLDRSGCPVFRANLNLPALWKDPAQQAKYLDKAAASDDPGVCRARLEALVNNASTGLKNQPTARETARMLRADDMSYAIMMQQISIMAAMFPGAADDRAKMFAGTAVAAEGDAAATTPAD